MHRILFLSTAVVIAFKASGQTIIRGRIVDKETSTAVAFANVVIANSALGTAADENGNFFIRVIPDRDNARLKVSSIGYITTSVDIDSLIKRFGDQITIALTAKSMVLNAVSIDSKRITAEEVLQNAVGSIEKNYSQHPFNSLYFSTISTQNSIDKSPYLLESVLLGYYEGYHPKAKRKFKILHKRESGKNPIAEYQYWPSGELFGADLLIHPEQHGIFNLKHLDKFELTLEGVTTYDQDTIQIISYNLPKPTKSVTGYGIVPKEYKGTLYIATNGAIVRHVLNTPPFQFDILYRKMGDHYFPYLVKGNRVYRNLFKINNTITLKHIELIDVARIPNTEDDWDVSKIPYDEEYWQLNYPNK